MVSLFINNNGERIEIIGDISLNLEYWDCECTGKKYIHHISVTDCHICNSIQDECPSSREKEVLVFMADENIIIS